VLGLRDRSCPVRTRRRLGKQLGAPPHAKSDDPVAAWEESMRVNCTGVFLMTRAFGQVMCSQQSGSIVNISSIQAWSGQLELYAGTTWVPPTGLLFHKAAC